MQKTFFSGAKAALQPQATCIRATTAGYLNIPGPSADGDSHRGLSMPAAQDAFDHGGSTPPYWNKKWYVHNRAKPGPSSIAHLEKWVASSVPRPLTDPMMPKEITFSQIQWSPEEPLGINFRSTKGTGTRYRQQRCWRAAAVHHLTWTYLIKESSKLSQLQAIILALEDTLDNRSHKHLLVVFVFFFRLLGHCQWCYYLVRSMAAIIPYPRLPL